MDWKKILNDYFIAVEKLYGTLPKAVLNFALVLGFYFVGMVAIMASGAIAYNIYHVPGSSALNIFNSVIFPLLSYVIIFQCVSITVGVAAGMAHDRAEKLAKRAGYPNG
jgi:hypothetical protein